MRDQLLYIYCIIPCISVSERWALNKRDEIKMEIAEMIMFRK